MRIISKFHDFYDGVQALGQDRSIVYVRETRALTETEAAALECEWPFRIDAMRKKSFVITFSPFWIAVAGKRYRGMRVRKDIGSTPPYFTDSYFYSIDACREHVLQLAGVDPFSADKGRRNWYFPWEQNRLPFAEWLSAQGTTELQSVMAERGYVTVACSGRKTDEQPYRLLPPDLNPRLADYDFFKVLDPYRLFQELSMWAGGVLPRREAMRAQVSDADRFVERGFDAVTSFRGPNR